MQAYGFWADPTDGQLTGTRRTHCKIRLTVVNYI